MNPSEENDDFTGVPKPGSASRARPLPNRGVLVRTHGVDNGNQEPDRNAFELLPPPPNPYRTTVESIPSPTTRATTNAGGSRGQGEGGRRIVPVADEWSFCDMQFRNIAGFTLKISGMPCSPSFDIRPNGRNNGLAVPLGSIFVGKSLQRSTRFCCDLRTQKWQTVAFSRRGVELFHFAYKPNIFGGRFSPVMSIYAPEQHDRIGYVKINSKLARGAEIVDCVRNMRFTTRPHFNEMVQSIEIVDNDGNVFAVLNGTWGKFVGNETVYQVFFSDAMIQESGYTKAIFLTALSIMAVDHRERFFIEDFFVAVFVFLMFVLLFVGIFNSIA